MKKSYFNFKMSFTLILLIIPLISWAQTDDVGVSDILIDEYGASNFTATTAVTVTVNNYGTADQTNVPVTLSVFSKEGNLLGTITEAVPSITNGTSVDFTFTGTVDLSAIGTYSIEAATSLGADLTNGNDQFTKRIYKVEPATFPYFEDFENMRIYTKTYMMDTVNFLGANGFTYKQSLPNERLIFDFSGIDAYSGRYFMGLDGGNFGENSTILTVDLSSLDVNNDEILLNFRYFDAGDEDGAIDQVYVRGTPDDPWVAVFDWNTIYGFTWEFSNNVNISQALINNSQTFSELTQIRFTQSDNFNFSTDGAGFDDIELFRQPDNDLGVIAITNPDPSTSLGSSESLSVEVENYGITDQSNFTIEVTITDPQGNVNVVSENVSTTVSAKTTLDIPLSTTFDFSQTGNYKIEAATTLSGDGRTQNDSFVGADVVHYGKLTSVTFPYEETFEAANKVDYNNTHSGISGLSGWTFENPFDGPSNRFRTESGFYADGNRSVAIDRAIGTGSDGGAILSMDLSSFDANDDKLYLNFDFRSFVNQADNAANRVFARGSEADPWIEIYDWFANRNTAQFINTGDINISDVLLGATQNFSNTFQIKFGINAINPIENSYGLVFDNVSIFQAPNNDVGIAAISTTLTGEEPAGVAATEKITITIENEGLDDQSNFDVSVEVVGPNGTQSATETFAGTVTGSGGTDTYEFTGDFDFSLAGTYTITANTTLGTDENTENDVFEANANVLDLTTPVLPYEETFETANIINTVNSIGKIGGLNGWAFVNAATETNRFRSGLESTPGTNRSIVIDNTTGSYGNGDAILSVDMSAFNVTDNEINLAFDFNTYPSQIDNANNRVFVRGSEADPWVEVYNWFANSGAGSAEENISAILAGATQEFSATTQIKFGWYGTGSTPDQGLNIDNVNIFATPNNDVRISAIATTLLGDEPADVATAEKITVTIANEGLDDQTNFDISLEVTGPNGTVSATETYAGTVTAGGNDTYEFTGDFDFSTAGSYTITASTSLGTDEVTDNDEFDTKAYIFSLYTGSLPFLEEFESFATVQSFQQSLAQIPGISNGYGYLYGNGGRLSFRPDFQLNSQSGKRIALDNPGGGGVNRIYISMDLSDYDVSTSELNISMDWYDHGDEGDFQDKIEIRGSSEDPWLELYDFAANSNNGAHTLIDLNISDVLSAGTQNFSASTQIRLSQTDNFPINTDGLSFDNINIYKTPDTDLGPIAITKPVLGTDFGAAENLEVEVENFGTIDVSAFDIKVDITDPQGNTTSTTESVASTINPGNTLNVALSNTFDFSLEGNYQIVATTVLGADENAENDSYQGFDLVHYDIIESATLPYEQDFESANYINRITSKSKVVGLDGWTFENETQETNRLRTAIDQTPGTNRSIVIDNTSGSFGNSAAILSVDMSAFNVTDNEVNLAFDFNTYPSQIDNANNRVFVRGSETDPWVEVYNWFANSGAGSADENISAILAGATQEFSATTQIKFGWYGTGAIPNQGLNVDNVNIYATPNNDVRVSAIATTLAGDEPAGVATAEKITITIFNEGLDDQSNFDVTVEVDGPSGIQTATETYAGTVTAGGTDTYEFTGDFDFSNAGTYTIIASTSLSTDEVTDNDELDTEAYIFSLYSGALPFYEGFESLATTQSLQQTSPMVPGISNGFAYVNTNGGRLAFRSDFQLNAQSGKRIALDNPGGESTNRLYFSFDLSAYDALNDDLNLSLDWYDHGDEGDLADKIEVRGTSDDPWLVLYDFATNSNNGAHTLINVSITDVLNGGSQNFSESTQIRLSQNDNFPINTDGLSFDNLYIHESISATQDESLTIEENAVPGDLVGSFTVENAVGNISATLLTGAPYFQIGANPQEIRVAQFLDYEDLLAGPGVIFDLDVEFTDESTYESYVATMTVEVTDDGLTAFSAPLNQITTEENKKAGEVVGQLTAAGGSGTFSGTVTAGAGFTINNNIDVVTDEFLDYEEIIAGGPATFVLTVEFYDEVTRETVSQNVEVTVTDDGITPVTGTDQAISVTESTAPNTVIATMATTDGSGDYSAVINNNADFTVNGSLEVSLVNRLDYESLVAQNKTTFDVPVTIIDNVTRDRSTAKLTVTVTDDGVNALVAEDQTIEVAENTLAGTVVGSIEVSGGSGNYEITNFSSLPSVYSLNTETFEVTTNQFVDYEAFLAQGRANVSFSATIQDQGTFDSKTITVTLSVQPDAFANLEPVLTTTSVQENTAIGTVVGQLVVNGGSGDLSATLTNSPSGLLTFDASTYEFTLAEFPDFEDLSSRGLATQTYSVQIEDAVTREVVTSRFRISITDDGIAKLTIDDLSAQIQENTEANVNVGSLTIEGGSGDVTLSNVSGASDYVSFDDSDLSFSTSQFIDYEAIDISAVNPILFELTFTDNVTQEEVIATATFVIANDNLAALLINDQTVSVRENVAIGTVVTTVKVTGGSGTADLTLSQSGSNLFNFDGTTGQLTVASEIDFETLSTTQFDFVFNASDDVTRESAEGTVTINITDDPSDNEDEEPLASKDEVFDNLKIYADKNGYVNIAGIDKNVSINEARVFGLNGKELMRLTFSQTNSTAVKSLERIQEGLFIISISIDGKPFNAKVLNR